MTLLQKSDRRDGRWRMPCYHSESARPRTPTPAAGGQKTRRVSRAAKFTDRKDDVFLQHTPQLSGCPLKGMQGLKQKLRRRRARMREAAPNASGGRIDRGQFPEGLLQTVHDQKQLPGRGMTIEQNLIVPADFHFHRVRMHPGRGLPLSLGQDDRSSGAFSLEYFKKNCSHKGTRRSQKTNGFPWQILTRLCAPCVLSWLWL